MARLALVTGGTRGIGASIVKALKKAGYDVAASYAHDDDTAQSFAKEVGVKAYKWDVADFAQCQDNLAKIVADFGKDIDILVNNAGITRDGMLHKTTPEFWHEVIEVNLSSCFNMCKAVIGKMRDNSFGRVINISSINALAGQIGQTNYSAAKAGIIGFSKSLARESAIKNITVNVIAPGYIATEMLNKVPKEVLDSIIKQIPVGRLGKPDDIARTVLFLASDDADFITGETLSVNGGHYMG